jgi:hypothetical protein
MANIVTVPNLPAITKADSKLGEALKKLQDTANLSVTNTQVLPVTSHPFDPTRSR